MITAQSPRAAQAGQCAFDQGKFWEYHHYLYDQARAIDTSGLKAAAAELGLDTQSFNQCLDSGQNQAKVDRSLQEAERQGFQGAPTFVINGQALIGPPTFEKLQQIIDPILASGG